MGRHGAARLRPAGCVASVLLQDRAQHAQQEEDDVDEDPMRDLSETRMPPKAPQVRNAVG